MGYTGERFMIEISDKQYWKSLSYDDMMLYLMVLSIDNKNNWRLPTKVELEDILKIENKSHYWYSDKNIAKSIAQRVCLLTIPVRDLI